MDNTIHWINFYRVDNLSPPQRLPLGISIKIAIIEKKIEKRAGGDGKREKAKILCSLFPLPIVPRALFFFLPSLPTRQTGFYGGERWIAQLVCLIVVSWC